MCRMIPAFATGGMDRVHRATRVIASMLRRDPAQSQDRGRLSKFRPTVSQPLNHRRIRIGGHVAVDGHGVLYVGHSKGIAFDRHRRWIKHVQDQGGVGPLPESVVRLAGVRADILQCHLRYHMLEIGGNETAVPPPADHADHRLRVYVALESRGAVHLDLERVLRADGHAREVIDVQCHRGVQSFAFAHRSISDDAPEDRAVVFSRGFHYQSFTGVQRYSAVAAVPSHFRLGTATVCVTLKLESLTLRSWRGSRRYRRGTRCSQHRQGDVLSVKISAGAADLHPTLVLAVVALVGHVPDLQIVAALLQIHEHLIVGRQRAILDRRVIEVIVRMGQPEARNVLSRRRKSALQLHRRAFVRVHLRLVDACMNRR